jgi:integrase
VKGTIWKRGDTWTYQFAVTRGGRRRFVNKGGYRTKRECEAALAEALATWEDRPEVDRKLTVVDYLRREWLPLQQAARKPSTFRGYRDIVENRLVPYVGDTRLYELSAGDVAALYTALRQTGRRNGAGGGISERSIKHTHSVLHSALEHAVDTGLIARNPARRLPKASRPNPRTVEMRTWTAEQLRTFLAATKDDRLHACYVLAATTGLRRSELLGLRWADIDLDGAIIAVRRGRVAAGYEVHEGEPKSGRARTVALDAETIAELRRHRARQLQERMAWGSAWTDNGLVFTREDGTGLHPQSLSGTFKRAVRRSDLPAIRFHDLRHTHASLLLAAGVHPKVVQERLGHSSITITLDLYSHVAPGMQEDAAGKLGALVFGG